jgi:hypothetical protein
MNGNIKDDHWNRKMVVRLPHSAPRFPAFRRLLLLSDVYWFLEFHSQAMPARYLATIQLYGHTART